MTDLFHCLKYKHFILPNFVKLVFKHEPHAPPLAEEILRHVEQLPPRPASTPVSLTLGCTCTSSLENQQEVSFLGSILLHPVIPAAPESLVGLFITT